MAYNHDYTGPSVIWSVVFDSQSVVPLVFMSESVSKASVSVMVGCPFDSSWARGLRHMLQRQPTQKRREMMGRHNQLELHAIGYKNKCIGFVWFVALNKACHYNIIILGSSNACVQRSSDSLYKLMIHWWIVAEPHHTTVHNSMLL